MQIRKVDRYVYDVFPDVGFTSWVRVRKFHWGCKIIQGNIKVERDQVKEIFTRLEQHPDGGLENV